MSKLTRGLHRFLSNAKSPCIHDAGRWFTHEDITRDTAAIRGWLAAAGIQPGDRIALGFPNSYAFTVVYMAVLQYGAVVVPIHPALSGPELRDFLQRSQAVCGFFTPECWTMLRDMCTEGMALTTVFLADPTVTTMPDTRCRRSGQGWVEQRTGVPPEAPKSPEPADDALSVLLYTSGTTGRPKAVGLRHRHLLATVEQVIDSHRLHAEDTTYCFLPLFHINAQVVALLSTCLSGGRIILAPKFSASRFWSTVAEHRVTWVSAVPTVIAMLLNVPSPERIPDQLRFIRSASAQLPPLHARRFERQFGVPVIQSYGMTEAASQICVNPLTASERRLGSVGLPVGLALQVVDEAGNPLPPRRIGEIAIRGDSVIERYEEADNQNDFREGWFHTGDLGYVDEEGYVFLTGRRKEMINRAGEKISPYEVEDVIREHPHVRKVAVIGLPDPLYGERVVAYIVTDGDDATEDQLAQEILELCRNAISNYKWPSAIHFVDDIPEGATGKIQRNRLKQEVLSCLRVTG